MQQRISIGSSRAPEENGVVNPGQQPQAAKFSPRNSMDNMDDLPIYDRHSGIGKRDIFRLRLMVEWVHCIPVIVLLCLLMLWWFSYPVNLVTKDGKIIDVHRILKKSKPHNNTHIHLAAFLGSATTSPPLAPSSYNLAGNNLSTAEKMVARGF